MALGIERVNEATTLGLRSAVSTWAGLRTFAPDRVPVVGEDPRRPGLFWLAGQGGYGIQTAPAMARCLAGLVAGPASRRRDRARRVRGTALPGPLRRLTPSWPPTRLAGRRWPSGAGWPLGAAWRPGVHVRAGDRRVHDPRT